MKHGIEYVPPLPLLHQGQSASLYIMLLDIRTGKNNLLPSSEPLYTGERNVMSRYRNSPIVEAVCEFRFSPDTPWEQDLPERFYRSVKDRLPIRESKKEQAFQIKTNPTGIEGHRFETIDIQVFLAEDRKMLVQLGPRRLSVNCIRPYPSWDGFRPAIHQAYETVTSLTGAKKLDRIGLLYVDKIEIPGKNIRLEDYFTFYPHRGEGLPHNIMNFMVGCDFSYNGNRDICRLKLTRAMPEKQNSSAYLLTTDYFLAKKNAVTPGDALAWVEEAHTAAKSLFKGCVTERLEEIFNQEEQHGV